jgi:hypothetical protein
LFVRVANVGDAAEGSSVGAEVRLSDCITAGVGDAVFVVRADEGALVGASEGALVGASVVSLFVGIANVGDDVDVIGAAEGAFVGAEVGLSDGITA